MIRRKESRPPPEDLAVTKFSVGGEYALLSFPLAGATITEALTAAEREVVLLALEGKSNVEIGVARGTSSRTVANQLASIYRKLGIFCRRELIARSTK